MCINSSIVLKTLFGQKVESFDNLFIGPERECVESEISYCQLISKSMVKDVNYIYFIM